MTDSLIERVARALRHAESYDASFTEMARSAIEAMREPTNRQLDAGYAAISEHQCNDDLASGWRAMIDEALK
jgi:hypothetical protein